MTSDAGAVGGKRAGCALDFDNVLVDSISVGSKALVQSAGKELEMASKLCHIYNDTLTRALFVWRET